MKYITIIFSLFILIFHSKTSIGQVNKIDSLKKLFKIEKSNEKRIDLLIELFNVEYSSNYEKGLGHSIYALEISKKIDSTTLLNKKRISQIHNNIGISNILLANYDESLKNLLISLQISESIKDTSMISNVTNNIGALYGNRGEMEKSYTYFIRSAELDEKSGNLTGAAGSYTNLSLYFFSDSSYVKGETYYNKAMKIYKDLGDDKKVATLYLTRAMQMLNQKKYNKAIKYYELAISINNETNDIGSLATAYLNLSNLYTEINKNKKAQKYGLLALDMGKKLNSPDHIMRAYQTLATINKDIGNLKNALEYTNKSAEWKDTIYNRENAESIAEMTAKYNFEKEEKENKILKQKAAINELELDNNQKELESSRIIIYSTITIVILFFLLSFSLYNRNKLKQKTNDKLLMANNSLTEAKEIIEEKNRDITASIEYAKYIQQAILPKKERIAESFKDSFLLLLPKDLVSGDFYWFQTFGDYSVLVMADCTGHGVPGGFMSMMGAEMLNQILSDPKVVDAGDALSQIDMRIRNNLNQVGSKRQQNDGMDIALCFFDLKKGTMQFSGANRPLVRVRDNELTMIKPNRFGVGGATDIEKTFTTEELTIQKGDSYYMYSDGYPDQFGGPKNKKFMRKRLNKLILEQSSLSMDKQEKNFLSIFYNWKGDVDQIDDVCFIGVKI